MDNIRLKTGISHIEDRLKYKPGILEFHLNEEDLWDVELLLERINYVQSKGVKVYLHHPITHNGKKLDILSEDLEVREYYHSSCIVLADICSKVGVKCVLHAHYTGSGSYSSLAYGADATIRLGFEITKILTIGRDYFLWEDSAGGLFSHANPYLFSHVIKPLNLALVTDISHSFIALKGNNWELEKVLKRTETYTKYYHLVDSMGKEHDALPIGEGLINWEMVKPYTLGKDFIFEIGLPLPHDNCLPMVESAVLFASV